MFKNRILTLIQTLIEKEYGQKRKKTEKIGDDAFFVQICVKEKK